MALCECSVVVFCRLALSAAKPNKSRGPHPPTIRRLLGFSRNKFRDQPNLQNYLPTSIVTPLPRMAWLNAGTVVDLSFSNSVRAVSSFA